MPQRLLLRLTLLLMAALALPAAADPAVEAAFQQVQRAIRDRDGAALERLVHPEFEMLHGGGQVERRDAWLRIVQAGTLSRQRDEPTEFEVTIRTLGPVAYRSSLVRFRNPGANGEQWVRGTAMFLREAGGWRQFRHQSSMLYDGPITEAKNLEDYVGIYDVPGREPFRVSAHGAYLTLHLPSGASVPLIPAGPDRFASGISSVVTFTRGPARAVTGISRGGREGPPWWTGTRRPWS
jgi:ketosteroid isomerase-like protein